MNEDKTSDMEERTSIKDEYLKELKSSDNPIDESTLEAEIQNRFKTSDKRKIINLYLNPSTFQKYSGILNLNDTNCDYLVHVLEEGSEYSIRCGVKIKPIYAKHNDVISNYCSYGLIFDMKNYVLVYTGDTGMDERVVKIYERIHDEYEGKGKKIVLLAHLGGFVDREENARVINGKVDGFYVSHLGRAGLVKINLALKPDFCLISEFGEEFVGNRAQIADAFNQAFLEGFPGNSIQFIPMDIGFNMNITDTGRILVSTLRSYDKDQNILLSKMTVINEIEYLETKNMEIKYCYRKASETFKEQIKDGIIE